jgi:hypothetical protein
MARFTVRTIWAGWLVASFLFATHPTAGRQLLVFVFLVASIALVVVASCTSLVRWLRSLRPGWMLPLGSALWIVMGALLGIGIARPLRSWTFFHRDLARYEQAAAWIEAQGVGGGDIHLPGEYADLAYRVWARKTEQCGQMIHFFWGDGFPVKHTARVYAPNVALIENRQCRGPWPYARRLTESWYELGD